MRENLSINDRRKEESASRKRKGRESAYLFCRVLSGGFCDNNNRYPIGRLPSNSI